MVDDEEWKQCAKFTNYEVSNLGQVRNAKTGRILKPGCRSGGYVNFGLMLNGKIKTTTAHQLVGLTFIDNPDNKPQINHIDKNKTNNNVSNLEWCTSAENNAHKLLTLTVKTNQNLKIWRVDIETNDKIELYNSIQEAAKWCVLNNYSTSEHNARGSISGVINRKYKTSCGFRWMLNEQPDLENEIWKNVTIDDKVFNKYYVSSLGRFKNAKGVIMEKYKPHHSGYIFVRVNKIKYALHRLVASTFIDNTCPQLVVNHIDGNKTNNEATNLEWCSVKENNQHNHNIGLIKVFTRKIGQYSLDDTLIKEFNSIVEAMRETNVSSIKQVLYNKQKTAGGFIWKYLD
jgi:hypothetical protein